MQAIEPLLDLAVKETHARGAYVYGFDREQGAARLVASVGPLEVVAGSSPAVQGATPETHFRRNAPIVVQHDAWRHYAFDAFPEFRANRFEGAVSIPLRGDPDQIVGMLNVCRLQSGGWLARDLEFLQSLSAAQGALLAAVEARASLEREVERLARELADRKLLDRAKGLIRARFECTEEQAYFSIRNLSRRRRTAMSVIAQEIIAMGAGTTLHHDAS